MFLCGRPKDAAAAPPDSLPATPLPPVPSGGEQQTPTRAGASLAARVVCRRQSDEMPAIGLPLGPQFDETGRGEIAVEGEGVLDALGSHEGEAGRIDERVLPLVVAAEPG